LGSFNANGMPSTGLSNDLNGNGIPDQYESGRSSFQSNDLNGNGIPDQYERPLNYQAKSRGITLGDLNNAGLPKVAPNQAPNSPFTSLRTM